MNSVVLTTAMSNLNNGVVSDGNLVEYPKNSAKEMLNLEILDNDIVTRRAPLRSDWGSPTVVYEGQATAALVSKDTTFPSVYGQGSYAMKDATSDPIAPSYVWFSTGTRSSLYYGVPPWYKWTSDVFEKALPLGSWGAATKEEYFTYNTSTLSSLSVYTPHNTASANLTLISGGGGVFSQDTGYQYRRTTSYTGWSATRIDSNMSWWGCGRASSTNTSATVANSRVTVQHFSHPAVSGGLVAGGNLLSIKRRVYEDVVDGVDIKEQPAASVVNAALEKNLLNRGWTAADLTAYKAATGTLWPAKSMVPWKGKNTSGAFTPAVLNQTYFNTSSAPTGSTIVDIAEHDKMVPHWVEAAVGRFWYCGFNNKKWKNAIFYSQLATQQTNAADAAGMCYSVNDPTAEYLNQPTAVDGGYIFVGAAQEILGVKSYSDGILIFATNGVWYLTGSNGQSFAGNAYSLYQVCEVRCLSAKGAVVVEGVCYFAAEEGYYAITPNPQTRSLSASNLTDGRRRTDWVNRIKASLEYEATTGGFGTNAYLGDDVTWSEKTFFRRGCVSAYDTHTKRVYIQVTHDTVKQLNEHCRRTATTRHAYSSRSHCMTKPNGSLIVYDILRGCFYDYTQWDDYLITDIATDNNGKVFFVGQNGVFRHEHSIDGEYKDTGIDTLTDTYTVRPYVSTFTLANENSLVDPGRQLNNLYTTFKASYRLGVDNGGCVASVNFDGFDGVAGRTSPTMPVYRIHNAALSNGALVRTKTKIRGRGRTFSIKFESTGVDKSLEFIGYQLDVVYPANEARRIVSMSRMQQDKGGD